MIESRDNLFSLEFLMLPHKNPMVSVTFLVELVEKECRSFLDWDETEPREIADASASMPAGWLESESVMIGDPEATKPADW